MKKFIYFLLAGLAAAGLASCEKQELKPTSEKDVYSIVIEEEIQTKGTVMTGDKKTFHAYLKKNGTPINCSDWEWNPGTLFRNDESGKCTYQDVTAAYMNATAIATGTESVTAKATVSGVGDISGNRSMSVKGISAFEFTVAKTSLTVGGNTTYQVRVKYTGDVSWTTVTSDAKVTSSNSSMLSASGGSVQSYKKVGCLGTFTLTAEYGGQTASKDVTVNTDYKSDDIVLTLSVDSGPGINISSGPYQGSVKLGDESQVSYSFKGSLKTTNNDTYDVSNQLIEIYETLSSPRKVSTLFTNWIQDGDKETYELRYLGKAVKTWTINWGPN